MENHPVKLFRQRIWNYFDKRSVYVDKIDSRGDVYK